MKLTPKGTVTRARILKSALLLFQTKGYDQTSMREIAGAAGVATGAAYRYFASKDAIVMAFYRQTFDQMRPKIEALLQQPGRLEDRMRELIRIKLNCFRPSRPVLRGIVKNGADPKHPVSPFSQESKPLRDMEIGWFRQMIVEEGIGLPKEFESHIPEVLWALHMGVIFFWIADDSPRQSQTMRLIEQGMNTVKVLLRLPQFQTAKEAS